MFFHRLLGVGMSGRLLLSLILLSVATGATDSEACTTYVEGDGKSCNTFDVSACRSIDTNTRDDNFRVKAVLYVPRPIGADPQMVDIYADSYNNLHERDLWIIKNVLKANAVRLQPWIIQQSTDNTAAHRGFIRLCRKMGLYIIPTFDFEFFSKDDKMKNSAWDSRVQALEDKFTEFLEHVKDDDPILMWSINHGLYLNETVVNGQLSINTPNAARSEYFQFLEAIRKVYNIHEWQAPNEKTGSPGRHKRPLGIPLLLDTYNKRSEINWYMRIVEENWDRWGRYSTLTSKDSPAEKGSFDVWILETVAAPTFHLIGDLNYTQWKTKDECEDDEVDDVKCGYNSKKAMITQFGFTALQPGKTISKKEIHKTSQQKNLQEIWTSITTGENCLKGGVVDEWVDDWDRCEERGYLETSGYMHDIGGACSQVKMSIGQTHVEWFGLNGQYSWLGLHCIDPRYNDEQEGFFFSDSAFKDTQEQRDRINAWKSVEKPRLCTHKRPSLRKLLGFVLPFTLFLIVVIWRCNHLRAQERRERITYEEEETGDATPGGSSGKDASTPASASSDGSPSKAPRASVAMSGDSRTVTDQVQLEVPGFLNDPHTFNFTLEVNSDAPVKKADRFTKDQVRFIITSHSQAQARRLQHQIESEAFAIQDKSRQEHHAGQTAELQLCFDQAMRNIHSKALEGYAAWLCDQALSHQEFQPVRDELLDNSARPPWELWVEALLLRVVESLSEQLLHSPELIHALYDRIRRPLDRDWPREGTNFVIDYRLLHQGIEKLKQLPNPYKGGVNFDDLNDCGRLNTEELLYEPRKTYQESSGLFVVIDVVSNFLPVICIKMWLFFLAWYLYLTTKAWFTNEKRNGDPFHPKFLAANHIQVFAVADASVGCVIEGAILLHGVRQGRLTWLGNKLWLMRHSVNLAVTVVGLVLLVPKCDLKTLDFQWTTSQASEDSTPQDTLNLFFGYWAVRLIVFLCVYQRYNQSHFIPGKPPNRKNPAVSGAAGPETPADGAEAGSFTGPKSFKEYKEITDGLPVHMSRRMAWFCMLGICFIFEVFFIAPLAADFDQHEFCELACECRFSPTGDPCKGLFAYFNVSNDCWSCRGTLFMTWALVLMTGFFDIYYMFYFGTAIVGYGMGEARGLRNVLSTALRYIDFNTRGTSLKVISSSKRMQAFSDGELMCRVFGTSWRIIWSRLVESLFEECLITAKERDNMVKAAGTMAWAKRKEKDNFKPSDTFECLKFVSTASRGANRVMGADVGHERTKCISGLLIRATRFSEAVTVTVPEEDFVTQEVLIASAADRDKIAGSLVEDSADNPDRSSLELAKSVDIANGKATTTLKEKWRIVCAADSALPVGNTEENTLNLFLGLTDFPAKVIFKTSAKYNECIVRLQTPMKVTLVSFLKTLDDPAMDPVQWRVEGLTARTSGEKEGQWKQLVWQDTQMEPRSHGRGEAMGEWFEVECWRQKMRSADSVDLNELDAVVGERLGFFAASLKGILEDQEHPVRHGLDSLLDSHVGNIPSLSQIIPVYGETIIIDEKNLMQSDGVNTNLGFIISQFENEWENFAKKLNKDPDSLYQNFVSGTFRERADSEDKQQVAKAKEAAELIMDIRMWASMRSQTVSRTVVGAIQYHEVLSLIPSIRGVSGDTDLEDDERVPRENLEKCVELILSHQTYGQKRKDDKAGPQDSDKDVQYLLRKYADKPFYLVIDYNESSAEIGLQQKVHSFLHTQYHYNGKVQFASILMRWRQISGSLQSEEDGLEIVDLLPRRNALLVGEGDFRTQGKAGNQLGALRFARGHYLQMMDSNMGAFLGEACKVPFVVRRFCPFNFNRASVTARIIGFREFIFTERHGTVGNIMASAEFSFGTICQRFLAGLGARMHYGHPDFLDGFWASNRGSLSKASPSINLSEDIFAGFNVAMRGEKSMHVDTLAWEKGREASFNASSLFFSKISGGNAGVMRSRDLKIISENLSITDNFSFYFASIGFYLNNLLIDASVMIYVVLFVLLCLASKTLEEVGDRYSLLATEWCLSMGIVAMFPRFMELTLEYGILEGVLRFVPSVPGCMTMFTFINKSISSAVAETIVSGKASYISTGRPNANTHYGWRECYFIFCKSHYYPALNVVYCYGLYYLLAKKQNMDKLPMIVLMLSVLLWMMAPILFCPQPTMKTLGKDLSQFWQFCIATPQWSVRKMPLGNKTTEEMLHAQISNPRSTLYEYWLLEELKKKQMSLLYRVFAMCVNGVKFLGLFFVVHTAMLDQIFDVFIIFTLQLLLMELWRLLYRPTALMMVIMIIGIVMPLWFFQMTLLDFMVVLTVFNYGMRAVEDLCLLGAALYYRPDNSWTKWDTSTEEERARRRYKQFNTRRYDTLVEYFYVNLQQHLLHLYCSVFILMLNLLTQLPLVFLDICGGLHSGLLLNSNLCGSCGAARPGYEPKGSSEDGRGKGRRGSRASSFFGPGGLPSWIGRSRSFMRQAGGREDAGPGPAVEMRALQANPAGQTLLTPGH